MRLKSGCSTLCSLVAAVALLGLAPASAPGQSARANSRSTQSGIGVARVASAIGDVSRQHGPRGDRVSAEPGAALVGGDSLFTGASSRAEVRLDPLNYLRLGANSEVRFTRLGQRSYRFDVVRGLVSYTMMKGGQADTDIHAPNASISPRKDGVYRLEVRGPQDSVFTVRKGEADVLVAGESTLVRSGKTVALGAKASGTKLAVKSAPGKDSFDTWVERRDKIVESGHTPTYAYAPWYPGYVGIGIGYGWPLWGGGWWPYGGFYGGGYRVVRPMVSHYGRP